MSQRAFEFLFLSWALATLAVHFDYLQDVVDYQHAQRVAGVRAIRHAIRTVDPAKLYAPAIIAPALPGPTLDCFSSWQLECVPLERLDAIEQRLRDLYIRELQRRGEAWSA